ncbi:MAG TPA: CocE/NonD family hydrolase [Candidatus Latescibacteria bacterium]|nr:CocE/NonD family hydrolase [Candidatus Handelsmanbacteria bacterium]HIL12004.1 CocE/NonD family hydrolase [Candidatus Latescibacterota bacterium]
MTSSYEVCVESDCEAVMRDGTILRADVYHPVDNEKYPALLCRTPYQKLTPRYVELAMSLASRGYTAIVQDQRGRYASDGEYRWMWRHRDETFDMADGYDSCEWAAGLRWSDGQVGTWGHSNASWLAWMLIASQAPSLKAALCSGIFKDALDLTCGIFETGRRLEWTYKMAADARRREANLTGPHTSEAAQDRWNAVERSKYLWWLPLADIPAEVFSTLDNQLQAYYREQHREVSDFGPFHAKVSTPIMQITGWWDRLIGTIDNFVGIVQNGPEQLRGQHRLIIGPWGHDSTQFTRKIGPVDYGPDADRTYADMISRWYDFQIKGKANGLQKEDPVQLYVLGENRWRGEKEWPLARTEYTAFYLHSGGSANTVAGNGSLSVAPPDDEEQDRYSYDPRDPVMSLMSADSQAAPVDQAPHDWRQDILFYQTPPFEQEFEVTGPVSLTLWAQTDAADTDWTAKLAVVLEDGMAVNLTYGIMRAQYREGFAKPKAIQPNVPLEYVIRLNPTGILFKPGQRLRLYVSSSDFPNFDRNHNTGKPYWSDAELHPAQQIVFHDEQRPSRLLLPVIPR